MGVTGASSNDIVGISHHSVRIQHVGCSMGGSLHAQGGYMGVTREFNPLGVKFPGHPHIPKQGASLHSLIIGIMRVF